MIDALAAVFTWSPALTAYGVFAVVALTLGIIGSRIERRHKDRETVRRRPDLWR